MSTRYRRTGRAGADRAIRTSTRASCGPRRAADRGRGRGDDHERHHRAFRRRQGNGDRRWPNREALLVAALREVKGRGPVPSAAISRRTSGGAPSRPATSSPRNASDRSCRCSPGTSSASAAAAAKARRRSTGWPPTTAAWPMSTSGSPRGRAADDVDGALVSDIVIGAQLARLLLRAGRRRRR